MPGEDSGPTKRSAVSPTKEKKKAAEKAAPKAENPDWKPCKWMDNIAAFQEWFMYNLPPQQPRFSFHASVDVNKGSMMLYLFALMVYFNNYSVGAWVYLSLHGSYGVFWASKSAAFPDAGFTRPATLTSCIVAPWPTALIPYYFIGYWMMSGGEVQKNPSGERIFVAMQMHVYGCVLTMLTDVQKYLVLKERRGLITHGMMGWSRNLNYLGEIMLYASFGVICQRWEVWAIYAYVWGTIFFLRMLLKEYSFSKKAGWKEYKARTWFFLPKLYDSNMLSYAVYFTFITCFVLTYNNGGIEKTVKMILKQ